MSHREVQIVAMIADVGQCGHVVLAKLPLQRQVPLVVLRQWRVVLVVAYALSIAGIRGSWRG